MSGKPFPVIAVLGAGVLGFSGVFALSSGEQLVPPTVRAELANCSIKGNISIETGERIYHVPGQTYYAQTKISPDHGERYFCSEADAIAAGWRRSRV